MTFSDEQKKMLAAKLDPAHIADRNQSGKTFYYIEGWHAIYEANRIFGPDGWSRETLDFRCVSERDRQSENKDGWRVGYVARVRVTAGGVVRDGLGAGEGIDRHLAAAHESALKEAETDAMKRALITFGNPFGLALYDNSRANVGSPEPEGPSAEQIRLDAQAWVDSAIEKIRKSESAEWLSGIRQNATVLRLRAEHPDLHEEIETEIEKRTAALTGVSMPRNGFGNPPQQTNGKAA